MQESPVFYSRMSALEERGSSIDVVEKSGIKMRFQKNSARLGALLAASSG
jgi:hypothetical protein